jgi:hypothetical protein
MVGTNPILPKPDWGQDAAYLAFVIDGLKAKLAAVSEVASHAVNEFETPDQRLAMIARLTEAAKGTMHDSYVPLDAAIRIATGGKHGD